MHNRMFHLTINVYVLYLVNCETSLFRQSLALVLTTTLKTHGIKYKKNYECMVDQELKTEIITL